LRIPTLFFLLLCCGTANANDGESQSADGKKVKQGDTIWLEEKISPTTTWIENLVKPLTVWMEQQINEPGQQPDNSNAIQEGRLTNEEDGSPNLSEVDPNNNVDPYLLIGTEQASVLAKEHIAGDVLHIKLMSKTKLYRVKLISKLGEIHIIFIRASSGEIVSPKVKATSAPIIPSVNELNSENGDKP
jgi:hypothetical protein